MHMIAQDNPLLAAVCKSVPFDSDIKELVLGMYEILNKQRGVGLAAPQVGITKRVIIVNYAAVNTVIINPVIIKSPGKIVTSIREGCLSFPGKIVDVKRSKRVIVEGFNEDWEPIKIDARNFLAFVMQHEIDHLNGVTIA